MFTRILVPMDATADGATREDHALTAARRLAEREGAQLVLLHVDADAAHAQIATRAALLDRATALRRAGRDTSVQFVYGSAGDGIARAAREEGADLIVISPRQRSLLRTLLRPGITAGLMRRAPAPLLIWPERMPGARCDATLDTTSAPVIVPLDGSPEAERALPLAEAFAQEHRRTLLLVIVAVPITFAASEVPYAAEAELPEERLHAGLHYLGRVRKEITLRTNLRVQTMGRIGQVAVTVADVAAAHPGSVVVMTTHGRGRAQRLLLGSVATEMLSLTPAPLLIVPPAHATEAAQADAEHETATEAEQPVQLVAETLGPVPTF
ncbi:MAG: universal stress protein [Ktedonobacterales bacterium]